MTGIAAPVEARARLSQGRSADPIYAAVAKMLASCDARGVVADVGCGSGALWPAVKERFGACIGLDAARYDGLPGDIDFRAADLDAGRLPLADASVDAVVAVEVIEHLENPRAFARELARIVRPGGWVVISTPNQLSLLSLLTLATRGRFPAFQDSEYPAHLTALLEVDLRRILGEAGLRDIRVSYTHHGRIPFTGLHYPVTLSTFAPRWLSDNVVAAGRR
jgi:2-polyprenyl-3-methyl-5-hydroxy-6-metoxy-1,4-benzoquinol methylase